MAIYGLAFGDPGCCQVQACRPNCVGNVEGEATMCLRAGVDNSRVVRHTSLASGPLSVLQLLRVGGEIILP
jgi:hypothetical protein